MSWLVKVPTAFLLDALKIAAKLAATEKVDIEIAGNQFKFTGEQDAKVFTWNFKQKTGRFAAVWRGEGETIGSRR